MAIGFACRPQRIVECLSRHEPPGGSPEDSEAEHEVLERFPVRKKQQERTQADFLLPSSQIVPDFRPLILRVFEPSSLGVTFGYGDSETRRLKDAEDQTGARLWLNSFSAIFADFLITWAAMEQRVALITGGARGIGRAVTLALAERGWAVAAAYRRSEEQARSLESELASSRRRALILQADLSKAASAEGLVERVEAEFGRIDALINCAGSYRRAAVLEETVEGWQSMFDDNLHPVFYLCRLVAHGMTARKWGRIVNFSIAKADQLVGQPFITGHYIAKVGVLILTRSLARVLAPHGVTVNAISPGFIETGGAPQQDFAQLTKNIPAGYVGSPEDAVSVVCYLLSDEARYVNGTNVHLGGAWGV